MGIRLIGVVVLKGRGAKPMKAHTILIRPHAALSRNDSGGDTVDTENPT